MKCYQCHREIVQEKIGFRDECPKCGHDLHICLLCTFYDPAAYRQCRETVPEAVKDKERANFCEYFRPGGTTPVSDSRAADAKSKLADLFKK